MSKYTPPSCPKCGSEKVIPIMYGMPTKKLKMLHAKGKIHHHGCEIYEGMPEWHCKECKHEWGVIPLRPND